MKQFLPIFLFPLLMLCSKRDSKDVLAIVGKSPINRDAYEAFSKVRRYYPTELYQYFPGNRSLITHMVETDAIFLRAKQDFAKGTIQSSKDWQWKKTFYSGQIYMMEYLSQNMGSTEDEIKNYYTSNKNLFKREIQPDSSSKDSVAYRDFTEVRDSITEILFLQKFPPDSLFLSRADKDLDKATINRNWYFKNKRSYPDFFMRAYFKEKFNKNYPDSISEVYGDNKIITPSDMDVILSWIKPEFRDQYKTTEGVKRLVEFLLQWKLFSEKAKQYAYTSTPMFKHIMEWAWKVEVANEYVKNRIDPVAKSSVHIDSSLIPYIIYDERGSISRLDSNMIKDKILYLSNQRTSFAVDSMIYQIRKSIGVQFLQNDIKDAKSDDPVALIKKADSLRDTGNIDGAQSSYLTLSKEFPFTSEGKLSQYELAKIQTEQQLYSSAINNYREYLLSGADPQKKSITFFMIGFIYDEYMDKSELAEINYKWVLKNDPHCDLADDAEFMMLHLDEPMNSVEELQAQTLRQNRKIDSSEDKVSQETSNK